MNDKLKKLLGKSEVFKYKDMEFVIEPFKGKELDVLFNSEKNDSKQTKNIVFESLKKTEEGLVREDIDEFPLDFILGITEVIFRVNGLDKVKVPGKKVVEK